MLTYTKRKTIISTVEDPFVLIDEPLAENYGKVLYYCKDSFPADKQKGIADFIEALAAISHIPFTISCVLKKKFIIKAKREQNFVEITFDTIGRDLIKISVSNPMIKYHLIKDCLTKDDSVRVFDFLFGIKNYV